MELRKRQIQHVIQFYNHSKDKELIKMFSFQSQTLNQAIESYEASLRPQANSYGKTIYVDNVYVGDIWCYNMDDAKSCFLSVVIFDKRYWKQGIGSRAMVEFIKDISERFKIEKICAFTYANNEASIAYLQKVGFRCVESFVENKRLSLYLELAIKEGLCDELVRH